MFADQQIHFEEATRFELNYLLSAIFVLYCIGYAASYQKPFPIFIIQFKRNIIVLRCACISRTQYALVIITKAHYRVIPQCPVAYRFAVDHSTFAHIIWHSSASTYSADDDEVLLSHDEACIFMSVITCLKRTRISSSDIPALRQHAIHSRMLCSTSLLSCMPA